MNNVSIIGRLTKEGELKYTNSGSALIELSLAVNERRKKGDEWVDEASFFDVTYFAKSAEKLIQYLVKGKQVGISGRLQQQRWEKDGQKRSKVVIIAHDLDLLGGNDGNGNGGAPARSDGEMDLHSADDKIPF